MSRWLLGLAAVAACEGGGGDGPTAEHTGDTGGTTVDPSDGDGDGYGASADCDDADPTVNPGVEERCDGLDTDCDPSTADPTGVVGRSDGGNHDSVAEAVAAAGAGATVWICGGTWQENVVVERDLSIVGFDRPTLDGMGLAPVIDVVGGGLSLTGVDLTNGVGSPNGPYPTNGGGLNGYGATGPLVLVGVNVTGSLAELAGGVLFGPEGGSFTDGEVTGNVAGNHGAGVFAVGDVTLTRVTLRNNTAAGYGGGFAAGDEARATLDEVTAELNSAHFGGGLYGFQGASLELTSTVVKDNTADAGGGGVYVRGGLLSGGEVTGNDGGDAGGGVTVYDGGTLEGVRIHDNDATTGGGLSLRGRVTLRDVVVEGNRAVTEGGGAYGVEAVVDADAATELLGNDAGERGGGLYLVDTTWTGGTVGDNHALDGGGAYLSGAGVGTSSIHDTTLADNRADQSGAGVFAGGAFSLSGVSFLRNLSLDRGGGLYTTVGVTGTVAGATFLGNTAVYRGGAVYPNDRSILTVTDTTIRSNIAERGAGLYLFGGSSVTLTDCTVEANGDPSTRSGGGARVTDGVLFSTRTSWGSGATENAPDDVYVENAGNGIPYVGYDLDENFQCDPTSCTPAP